MTTFRTRTRRGAAILFSGVLVLGGLALTGEASAVKNADDNPTCEYLGFTYGEKWDNEPSAGTYTLNRDGMEASLTVGTYPDKPEPNENNAIIAYSATAGDYAIVVKGGDGANVYDPGAAVPLHAPAVGNLQKWPTISHFDLCWNKPTPPPEPGRLEVTKVVVGDVALDELEFEICVTPAVGGEQRCTTIEGAGTATFENLPPGDYVVTETDPGPMFSVSGSGVTVTVESDSTATATVTNTWIPPSEEFGSVEVTKVVTGAGAPTDDEYEICLTGPAPSTARTCTTLTGEGTVTFEHLVPGIYTVSETDPGTEYEVTITPETVEVEGVEVALVTVTNAFTEVPEVPTIPEVPTVEVLPPTVTPTAPTGTVASATPTALPTTGSEGGLATIATILVAAGAALTTLSRRRGPQQA